MDAPAMSASEIARHPNAAVRINCYQCQRCLFAGDDVPEGGAEAVYQGAGCHDDPTTCPGATPDPATSTPLPTSRPAGRKAARGVPPMPRPAEALTPAKPRTAPAAAPSKLASRIRRGDPATLIDSAAVGDEAGAT